MHAGVTEIPFRSLKKTNSKTFAYASVPSFWPTLQKTLWYTDQVIYSWQKLHADCILGITRRVL